MCGIFGAIGTDKALSHVMEGLSRLEYRGYDSSGVAIGQKSINQINVRKEVGKLEQLRAVLNETDYDSSDIVIGHTRWATHGQVNKLNAHPHSQGRFAIVHNGIIENANSIKNSLALEGYNFVSETDTEVFLALLHSIYRPQMSLEDVVAHAFKRITGNSAVVVMDVKLDKMVAVKRGAPLVFANGRGNIGKFVSSDPYALMGEVEHFIFPEDEVMGIMRNSASSNIEFYDLEGHKSEKILVKKSNGIQKIHDKGRFEHFMLKEIYEQPLLVRNIVRQYRDNEFQQQAHALLSNFKPNKIHIVACGTAWHAGLLIKKCIEKVTRIPVDVDLASEFRYRQPLLKDCEIGLFISQSGETADTLAAQQLCQQNNLKTLSIVNVEGSSLYRACDANFLLNAGAEIGVASTKAFTLQAIIGHLMGAIWINSQQEMKGLLTELNGLASSIEGILERSEELKSIADELYKKKGFIFTGRGACFPIALEGALKLKEITYVHAEGYAAGELKHGPIALIDESIVNIALIGQELVDKTISNVQEIKARRGIIFGIGPSLKEVQPDLFDYYFTVDSDLSENIYPLLLNVVLQLFSYKVARLKGTDIDRPRNLAKSVTVE